jgi:hypothetical protein
MTEPGANLGHVISGLSAIQQTGSLRELAPILDENVFWQGPQPDLSCSGREEVLRVMSGGAPQRLRLTKVEVQEFGERVVISVEGPGLPETPVLAAGAPRTLVFTFADGKVIRIESFSARDAAFTASGPG